MSIKDFFLKEWPGVADAWQKWGNEARAQSAAATDWIIELARVGTGMRVLDLASGVGEPALELARRVGPTGQVVASDLVGGVLSVVAQAASAEGLTWLTTETADMESLPFDDTSFDAVTCRLGLMFSPQLDLALAEARRVLKPGGRAAFIAWGSADQPLFRSTLAEVARSTSQRAEPTPQGVPGPFRFERRGSLSAELERAGFSAATEEHRQIRWPFRGSAAEFWEMFKDLGGPSLRQAISALESSQQVELSQRIVSNLSAFEQGGVVDPTALVVGCSGTVSH